MLEVLLRNWPLKLLALAIASVIWATVTGEKSVVQDFDVPLEIDLGPSRIFTVDPPNTVTVRLRGVDGLMRRLDPVPLAVRVQLDDAATGDRELQLSSDNLSGIPRGIEVEFIDPDRLSLNLDRRARRELPVDPTFLGQPPEGFEFYGARVRPETVTVEGPATEVDPLEVVRTNPIRLDQRRQPFGVEVNAIPGGTVTRVIDLTAVNVQVTVDVSPVERRFDDVRVSVRGQLYASSVAPETLRVTISGPPAIVEPLLPEEIVLVADVAGLVPQEKPYPVEVRVDFPSLSLEEIARISVKSISRRKVAVTIREEPIEL